MARNYSVMDLLWDAILILYKIIAIKDRKNRYILQYLGPNFMCFKPFICGKDFLVESSTICFTVLPQKQ